eukprot:6206382-Pleurochrysis_carterae.AAC.1
MKVLLLAVLYHLRPAMVWPYMFKTSATFFTTGSEHLKLSKALEGCRNGRKRPLGPTGDPQMPWHSSD